MTSLAIGLSLTAIRKRPGGAPADPPVTGTAPTLAALTDGDTLSSRVTWGSYSGGNGGPYTPTRQMRVNSGSWTAYVGSTVVDAGEVWQVREQATDGVQTSGWQSSAAQTVGASVPLADTTLTDTITVSGVTFTLSRTMPVCYSCLGDPAIIATEAFSITAISPASAVVDSYQAHGLMINPDAQVAQGFDAMIGAVISSADATAYSAGVNLDPAVSGAIAFAAGGSGSVVKSVRMASAVVPDWQVIDRYVVLSVLPTTPPEGFFRPPMSGTDKSVPPNWREGAVNYGVLRDLPVISGGMNQAAAEAAMKHNSPYFMVINSEKRRRFDIEGGGNYSRDYGLTRNDALTFLHSDVAQSAKRLTFLRAIQKGIDLHGMVDQAGFTGLDGAGQGYGRQEFPYLAAFALNDADILASARAQLGNTLAMHFWIDAERVGFAAKWPHDASNTYKNNATYVASDIGAADWRKEPNDHREDAAQMFARYRDMGPSGMLGWLNIGLLQNGPGGIDGVDAAINGARDTTNPRAAAPAHYDRMAAPNDTFDTYLTAPRRAAWDARRPLVALTPWTGRPDWSDPVDNANVTAGAGQIAYDWSTYLFSTLPITRRDVRYSLDGVQWIEQTDVSATGVLTGLTRGLFHEVAHRLVNSAGPGRWTMTWPHHGPLGVSPQRRNRVAPTGTTTAAAPVATLAPAIYVPRYEAYAGEEYDPAPATISTAFMARESNCTFIAGLGYWTGYPAPTFAYQWRLDGVDIAGATAKTLTVLPGEMPAGGTLTCRISATNASGTVTADTNAIAIPAEVEPPAPTAWPRVSNGGTAYLLRSAGLLGAANGKQMTMAIRGRMLGGDGTIVQLFMANTSERIGLQRRSSGNRLRVTLKSSGANLLVWDSASGTPLNTATGDFTLLVSANLGTGALQMYLNGAVITGTPTTLVDAEALLTASPLSALASVAGAVIPNISIDYIYYDDVALDLSNPATRAIFGDPEAMGAWGDGPSGARPLVYIWGDADDWNAGRANKGTGGAFAVTGAFSDVP